jgi:hypothetical protein
MTANLPRPSVDENISTTLSAGITDVATSFDVADASKIVSPCYLVIDRVDSAGTVKASTLWEYVKVTDVTSNTLTVTRAQGGSTQQSHSSGAVIEAVITSSMFEDWYNAINPEHTASGGHVISTATITSLYGGSATIGSVRVPTHLNVANASISGIGLNPTWYIPSLPSLASVGLGRPMAMPRPGTLQFVSVTLNANISSASIFFDVNKNFTSIFDPIGRPMIAGGTYASTASIKTTNFKAGDVFNVDYDGIDLGGNSVDAVVTLSSY